MGLLQMTTYLVGENSLIVGRTTLRESETVFWKR
jgi:hypothetical protein